MTSSSSPETGREPRRWRGPLGRLLGQLAEAQRVAVSQPMLSGAVAVVCAGVVVATLATSGRTVGAERAVLARIDDAGTRTISVIDDRAAPGLNESILAAIERFDATAWVIGLGPIQDVRPAGLAGSEPVPARLIAGTSPYLTVGREPEAEPLALVAAGSQRRLGLAAAAGTVESVTGQRFPVLGAFAATGPLAELQETVLLLGTEQVPVFRRITMEARSAEQVVPLAGLVRTLVGPAGEGGVAIDVSGDLVRAQQAVRGELSGFGRAVVLQALGAGLVLMAGAVLAGVNARRRDFGRRRALGAARSQLVVIVVGQALWSAFPGVAVGAIAGSAVTASLAGTWPGWRYPLAISVLTALGAALAAVAPAVVASFRDPVVALRVP